MAVAADNRSYRYGDGLFETMKVRDGKVLLAELHFERLLRSLQLMKIPLPSHFSTPQLLNEITQLCAKNNCSQLARVRLTISAGTGGLFDEGRKLNYTIEAWQLGLEMEHLNSNGLVIGIFREGRKATDQYANLKSSNFLVYSMAAIHARENKWNDALVLNSKECIADSTIANLFIIQDSTIYTPPLSEGCVDGVLRRLLISNLAGWGYTCKETVISENDLSKADGIFLTNAIRGLRWVKQAGEKEYENKMTPAIYKQLQTIWK